MAVFEKNQLVYAIINFLEEEIVSDNSTPDCKEALEVASQCLENAFGINSIEPLVKAQYALPANLMEIFKAGLKVKLAEKPKELTEEERQLADEFKVKGNDAIKAESFKEAVEFYSKAIEIDGRNAVYFCNRAAAYSRVEEHNKALEDCLKALEIDPHYGKAYGRKGLAHNALNQHYKAKDCFEKALELDPTNESYKTNLKLAEEKVAELEHAAANASGFSSGLGGFGPGSAAYCPGPNPDLTTMMQNPAVFNMAQQVMTNPHMQQMMTNMMNAWEEQGFTGIMEAGQRLAQEMELTNPELVAAFRTQLHQPPPGNGDNNDPKPNGNQ